jgi:hypothetical protein
MATLDYEKLKQTKVTIPIVVLIGFVWLGFNAKGLTGSALGDLFLSKAVAEEQFKVFTEQVTETRVLIVTHIQEYKLNENAKETRQISNELYNLQLYVAANGSSELTSDRQRDLQNQLATLGRVRSCVIRNAQVEDEDLKENCDAII